MGGRRAAETCRRLVVVALGALLAFGTQPDLTARADEPVALAAPVVSGTPEVGATLRVDGPDPSATYQWYRAGRPIPGATGASYRPVAADAGHPVWVAATRADPDAGNVVARSRLHLVLPDWQQRIVAWDAAGHGIAIPDLADAVALAAGRDHTLALLADGTVAAWGADDRGQASVPDGLSDVVAVSAGVFFSTALRSDGTVVAWGAPNNDRTTVPAGLTDVVEIASGNSHTLALRSDGTVVAWGFGTSPPFTQAVVPDGLDEVVAVAAGGNHSLALRADGTVVAWGYNYDGQSRVPAGLSDVVAIAGTNTASLALRADGSVVEWGQESTGFPSGITATSIAGGEQHALATLSDGSVVGWTYYGPLPTVSAPAGLQTATALAVRGDDFESHALVRVWTDTPRVAGTPQVGRTLTAGPGDWVPGAELGYQWLRNGKAIKGATTDRYRLTGKDAGTRISVRVTGTLAGYTIPGRTSPATAKVMKAGTPTIRGSRTTGSTLTVSRGSWTGKTRFSYQWLRDGKPIRRATSSKYRLTRSDAGHRISVRVTGRRSGYATVAVTSAQTTRVLQVATPTVKGIREVGRLLRVEPGAWSPGTSFSYRWYANGRLIANTRSPYLWASSSLRGTRITVSVTGRRSGFASATRTSRPAGPIQ